MENFFLETTKETACEYKNTKWGTWLAHLEEHMTLDLEVISSTHIGYTDYFFFNELKKKKKNTMHSKGQSSAKNTGQLGNLAY